MSYLVVMCPKCGAVRCVEERQRSARCFSCGYRMQINPLKIRILLRTRDKDRAIEAVKRYKVRAGRLRESLERLKRDRIVSP